MNLKSKILMIGLFLSLIVFPSLQLAASNKATAEEQGYQKIHAKELKSWIDSGKKFQLIDARPKKYEKGDVIVGAKFLAYDSDEQKIAKMLPNKDQTIVVYCASIECPASTYLAKQLVAMGYKHVYKYPEGINDWMDKEYPIQKAD